MNNKKLIQRLLKGKYKRGGKKYQEGNMYQDPTGYVGYNSTIVADNQGVDESAQTDAELSNLIEMGPDKSREAGIEGKFGMIDQMGSMVTGGGGKIGQGIDALTDDGDAASYSGKEILGDVGQIGAGIATGDPRLALEGLKDMGVSIFQRGKMKKELKRQEEELALEKSELSAESDLQESRSIMQSGANTGATFASGLQKLEPIQDQMAKKGGLARYFTGGLNVGYDNAYVNPGAEQRGTTYDNVALNQEDYSAIRNDGMSRSQVDLYGGQKFFTKGNQQFSDNPYNNAENVTMQGTVANVQPLEMRLGLDRQDQRGGQFADIKPMSGQYKNFLANQSDEYNDNVMSNRNDKLYRKQVMTRKKFQDRLGEAQEAGKEKKFLRNYDRDAKRMEKFGNTESGFRNFFRNIFGNQANARTDAKFEFGRGYLKGGLKEGKGNPLYKQGGMSLPGGMAEQIIPGDNAVQFKGNRHSKGGIQLPNAEVEGGETMDTVSSMKHGGKHPYFFSDYVNVDGSKKYGGYSFADAHKKLLQMGGSDADIDMLARNQELLSGRNPNNIAISDNTRMAPSYDIGPDGEFIQYRGGNPGDYGEEFWTGKMPKDKADYAKNFKQSGGFTNPADYTWYDTGQSYFGPSAEAFEEPGNVMDTIDLVEQGTTNYPSLTPVPQVTSVGNPQASGMINTSTAQESSSDTDNTSYSGITGDAIVAGISSLPALRALRHTPGQLSLEGAAPWVKAQLRQYTNLNAARAQNERDYQGMRKFIETSGMGPGAIIASMAAYGKKMRSNERIAGQEANDRTKVDNLNADAKFKASVANAQNKLLVRGRNKEIEKFNLNLMEDKAMNDIEALQTLAQNIQTMSRDNKAYEASMRVANAIDGGSGVLSRALNPNMSPKEQSKILQDFLAGKGYQKADAPTTSANNEIETFEDEGFTLPVVSDSTAFSPDLNITNRGVSNTEFGDEARVGMFNLQQAISGEDYGSEGFTITSAKRGEDHPLYNPSSLHASGNAVDFGVKDTDGKAMMKFFFNDWDTDAKKLSAKGRKFLQNNNAELVDERSRDGQAHFHLEFNKLNTDVSQFYPDGAKTSDGKFLIYGMQQS